MRIDGRHTSARQAGFTLVECLVVCAITCVLAAAALNVVALQSTIARAQPEQLDAQQRARSAATALARHLSMAGAGIDAGPRNGPLLHYLPPIVPRRAGLLLADAPAVVRADTVTLALISSSFSQSTLASPVSAAAPTLLATPYATCPPPASLCGLSSGATVVAYSASGLHSWYRLTTSTAPAALAPLQASTAGQAAGDVVAEAERHTYYFDAGARQLRHYDGAFTDVPVVDDVVALQFEYFGEPASPTRPKPPIGEANCLYDATGTFLPLPALPGATGSLTPLPLSLFADGPWCGAGAAQFDADLLRIRTVRVRLRVQASAVWARALGPAFLVPGTARSALLAVPDVHLTFDVSPRNMSIAREVPA